MKSTIFNANIVCCCVLLAHCIAKALIELFVCVLGVHAYAMRTTFFSNRILLLFTER